MVLRESALADADKADAARRRGSGVVGGAFHGVPFTIKENIDCVGTATTHGVPTLEQEVLTRALAQLPPGGLNPGTLVRTDSAGATHALRLPRAWPWADALIGACARLHTLPAG